MYKIIKSRTLNELESTISSHLSTGYLLAGGLQIIYHRHDSFSREENATVDFKSSTEYQQVTFAQAIYLPQTKEPTCLT